MAASGRSVAQENSDSQGGYRSLAGYVFQLLGSMAESVELVRLDPNARPMQGLITLEQFGQDSFVAMVPGIDESRLTQYKHSLIEDEIQPDELRIILESFVKSIGLAERRIEKCQFVLATSRDKADWTSNLMAVQQQYLDDPTAANEAKLEKQFWKGTRKERPDCADEMLAIMKKLTWKAVDHQEMEEKVQHYACELGVLPCDTAQQIGRALGLFLGRADSKVFRSIFRNELNDALAGHPAARTLRNADSRREQQRPIKSALQQIHEQRHVARRSCLQDILNASLAHKLVIVVGDGGRGKSAASWQTLLANLESESRPFDFVAGWHFSEFIDEKLIDEFARWRNQTPRGDGTDLGLSLLRLGAACPCDNLMVLYIDGIDEREGMVKPNPASQRFVAELLQQILPRLHESHDLHVSIIVSCRTIEEAAWLTRIMDEQDYHVVPVEEFSNLELQELATILEQEPQRLLLSVVSEHLENSSRLTKQPESSFVDIIREPRVWAAFADLELADQIGCLQNSDVSQKRLVQKYIQRIEEKAADRLAMQLGKHQVESMLVDAADISLSNNNPICTGRQWLDICAPYGLDRSESRRLFDEFVTAGLLSNESKDGQRWTWKQTWLRDILCQTKVTQ